RGGGRQERAGGPRGDHAPGLRAAEARDGASDAGRDREEHRFVPDEPRARGARGAAPDGGGGGSGGPRAAHDAARGGRRGQVKAAAPPQLSQSLRWASSGIARSRKSG